HPRLQQIHRLKDPHGDNAAFQFPKLNYLLHGRLYRPVTYGPANCHGTAQAVAGPFLLERELEGITYHSEAVREKCAPLAERRYAQAVERGPVTGTSLGEVQVSINMVHSGPHIRRCGRARLSVYDCEEDRWTDSVFIEGMGIECWASRLKEAGYHE